MDPDRNQPQGDNSEIKKLEEDLQKISSEASGQVAQTEPPVPAPTPQQQVPTTPTETPPTTLVQATEEQAAAAPSVPPKKKSPVVVLAIALLLLALLSVVAYFVGTQYLARPTPSPEATVSPTFSPESTDNSGVLSTPSPSEGEEPAVVVTIANFKFAPETISVKPGQTIVVQNNDAESHTMTSDVKGVFDTGDIGGSESTVLMAPDEPGSYSFHCAPHPEMKGTLIVTEVES